MGATLRELRLKRGMTIRGLASKAGIDFSAIWRYEKGERRPSWENEHKLAEALRCSVRTIRQAIVNAEAARAAD